MKPTRFVAYSTLRHIMAVHFVQKLSPFRNSFVLPLRKGFIITIVLVVVIIIIVVIITIIVIIVDDVMTIIVTTTINGCIQSLIY